MEIHSEELEKVISDFETNVDTGLTAEQVKQKQEQYGPNKLEEKKKKSWAARFFEQFKDVMIVILIIAAVISFVIACIEKNPQEFFEPALILLIVIVNAIMGVMQESKAEKALEALNNMSAPHARVIRDGQEKVIQASELVPGDIIVLDAGDFVPADARLIKSFSLKSEESALTGESVPTEKSADKKVKAKAAIGDRANMVFSGCSITYGSARAVVVATGMNTEMGKIANLLSGEEEGPTPLQQKLSKLGKYLGFVALAACAVVFVIGILSDLPILAMFMTAVSLAVSAIPEGLPAIVTIVLSIGVQRMVKKNAIIRRLPAVETLGSASIICSDKTGTLTMNRMTLVEAYTDSATACEEINKENSPKIKKLLTYAALCCDGSITFEKNKEVHIGDPTETAIISAAYKNGIEKDEINKKHPRLATIPFDSNRKLMTTINQIGGKKIVIVKGAVDVLETRCIAGNFELAKEFNESMSSKALRVLAVAYKEIDEVPEKLVPEEIEDGLTFMGLVGMIDPPRPKAKAAVTVCKEAGIKPIMITGDHVVTATAIAKQLGIYVQGDRAITGSELDEMTDRELDLELERITVYARVSPENKIRIVKAWQRKGQVVSMTGDGVNDAPALKAADIGCAMGITGTDVAKGSADMILTDDNFTTIVDAVREGRGIYANIKKVVGFLLGTNIGEVVAVFLAMIFWHKSPFLSMQLLMINLVTDSLPAIALGMEAVEADVMKRKPKPKHEGLFAHGLGVKIVLQGIMFGILALIGFRVGEIVTGTLAGGQTLAFMTLALSQVLQAYNMRSDKSLFKIGPFSNHKLNWSCFISIALMAIVIFTPVRIAFGLAVLPAKLYLLGLGLAIVPIVVMEIAKLIEHIYEKVQENEKQKELEEIDKK